MSSTQKQRRQPIGWLQRQARFIWLLQRTVDAGIVVLSLGGLAFVYGVEFSAPYILLSVLSVLILWPVFKGAGIYYSYRSEHPAATYPRLGLGWLSLCLVLLLLGYITQTSALFSRQLMGTWFVLTPLALCTHHFMVRMLLRKIRAAGLNSRKAVIAGTGALSQSLAQQIQESPQLGLQFCGFFAEKPWAAMTEIPVRPLVGTIEELPDYVRRYQIDVVYVAVELLQDAAVNTLIESLRDTTACVYFVPNMTAFSLMQASTHNFFGIPMVAVWETPSIYAQVVAKRLTDIVVAAIALFWLSPVMLVIAIAIKFSSPGPVLTQHKRYGFYGQPMVLYHFRVHHPLDATSLKGVELSQKLTRLGKLLSQTGLASLPQLINVFQGDLSLVGPQPHIEAHKALYRHYRDQYRSQSRHQYRAVRLKAKPGLAGLAQVHRVSYEGETAERLKTQVAYDLDYLQNWSLGLDLKIMLQIALQTIFQRHFTAMKPKHH